MIPGIIKDATHVMRAPDSWPADQLGDCGDLYVKCVEGQLYISEWVPSRAERLALASGGRIWLTVVGMQPPVSLAVVVNNQTRTEPDTDAEPRD